MRIYLPATLLDLADLADLAAGTGASGDVGGGAVGGAGADASHERPDALPAPRRAHAVTAALRAMFPDEDDEGLEYAAQLAAADDSLELVAGSPEAPRLRLVLTADVGEHDTAVVADDDAAPSAVEVTAAIPWDAVACAHVDEPAAAGDVAAALAGDPDAVERLDERDLLWYDATELRSIPR
ncbi:DUF6912 family protein [Cellulomonas fimi]|uniref:DUF6912 family protein n=1 Tax=Cellulomonas fimi TaxID=1708 RepID=UPI002892AFE5|nr:hypothetical protein [Cellulomonas fimi]